ncbi:hypothetical protein [Clostridium ihumii]|uniref:hypothetical protein n=1 Tax=Clostridium ihumii TaxID=1470356 RepID=UPI000590F711|nr:hypothetical protein [Clostridium ihumii]
MNCLNEKDFLKTHNIIGGSDGEVEINIDDDNKFLEYASSKIKANNKSFLKVEEYLIKNYNAVPFQVSGIEKEMFLEILKYSYNLKFDELDIRAYKLISDIEKHTIIQIEVNSGNLRIVNGNNKLYNDIIIYMGVTKRDIDMKTPRFKSYAYAMKSLGKI